VQKTTISGKFILLQEFLAVFYTAAILMNTAEISCSKNFAARFCCSDLNFYLIQ